MLYHQFPYWRISNVHKFGASPPVWDCSARQKKIYRTMSPATTKILDPFFVTFKIENTLFLPTISLFCSTFPWETDPNLPPWPPHPMHSASAAWICQSGDGKKKQLWKIIHWMIGFRMANLRISRHVFFEINLGPVIHFKVPEIRVTSSWSCGLAICLKCHMVKKQHWCSHAQ